MTDGLKDVHREAITAVIAANDRVERAVLFGSRATGTNTVSSDVDIALFGNRLTLTDQARLAAAIDKVPMAQSVDLLLHDSIRDRTLREHIRSHGIEWYARSNAARTDPEEWPIRRFEELLSEPVRNGIYKSKEHHGHGLNIVNMGEIFAHPRLRAVPMRRVALSESEIQRFSVARGDLLFARRSLVAEGAGKCCVVLDVDEPTTFESSIIRARPDAMTSDPLFLYYFFCSPSGLHRLDTIRRQVAVAGITGRDLSRLEIPVPPLAEQRAIARVLGTLDDKIELNRRMNVTLEAVARALFWSWFVDFDPVRAKMEGRDTGLPKEIADLFPDRLVASKLGEVPDGWAVGVLDDAVELLNGGTPRTSVAHYWNGDVRWYTAKDAPAPHDVFVVETERTVTQAGVDNSATTMLPPRTTVISARGTVGRLACLGRSMAMNQTCYGIRGAGGYRDFFTYWLVRRAVEDLRSRTHGTIFDTITRQTFAFVDVALPSVSVADAFESAVMPIMERILSNLHQSRAIAALRDTLLPKLVSGELRVSGLGLASVRDEHPASVGASGT